MSFFNLGIGVFGLIILMGILFSGVAQEAQDSYSDMNIDSVFDFDELLEDIDVNTMTKLDSAYEDKNILISFKKTMHYVGRSVIDGFYSSIYIGKFINETNSGVYEWARENSFLIIICILIIMFPDILNTLILCLLGIILIIKERFIKKEHMKPKNKWRDNSG